MHILISNDDGIDAPGLQFLHEAIKQIDNIQSITVIAPVNNCSGASSSITLLKDIRVDKISHLRYAVNGSPADCVHLALSANLLPHKPNLVVSGINRGANLGDDTIYSGTVACAIEAHLFNIPAIAFSLVSQNAHYFETGKKVAIDIVQNILSRAIPNNLLLNVNIPDIAYEALQGTKVTHLGKRNFALASIQKKAPVAPPPSAAINSTWYQLGDAGTPKALTENSDFYAIDNNCVSITPLQVDLTSYKTLDETRQWFQ